ncbi:IclR family transcriptional regulator [Arthrobacter sp. B0490]|uniref:IclR family transcriptional regulator n=1 Tax=Arthrobacter sp. B0490 TaxID=2058891 RepID=UPI000CE4534F|nr:IclR family transcriptional regulator C-terminal domain-containing protein [Arthrobacter sp. B0490]
MEQADQGTHRDGAAEIFSIVEALIGRRNYGWGVRELADHLGANRSTVNRLLSRLVEERLASRDVSGAYVIGPRLKVLATTIQENHPLFVAGGRILSHLSATTGATAVLAVESPKPEECFVLVSKEPTSPVRYTLPAGTTLPTHAGALGLAILSRRGTAGLSKHLKTFTADSRTDVNGIQEVLDRYADLNAVVSIGQHIPDAAGIAVPLTITKSVTGSISVSRPRNEFRESDIVSVARLLNRAAAELEANLDAQYPVADPSVQTPNPSTTLIQRISRLLTALCANPAEELNMQYLTTVMGTRSVATRRLIDAACEAGLMTSSQTSSFSAGPTLLRWAAALGCSTSLQNLIDEDLQALSADTGETVGLAIYDHETQNAHFASTYSAVRTIQYVLELDSQIPLHAGAAGKAILAHLPEQLRPGALKSFTERTITDPKILTRELGIIRTRGWAAGDGERIPEAYGVAAPFFINGLIGGSITITIARYRIDEVSADKLAEAIVSTARKVTELLSITDSSPKAIKSGRSCKVETRAAL